MFGYTCRLCNEWYKRECEHLLSGTGMCDVCFDKEYDKIKITGDPQSLNIKPQIKKVKDLCKDNGHPATCIRELLVLMTMFIENIDKKQDD